MTYEVLIRGGELSLQEPLARVLCPVEAHDGPCEVPWGFSVSGEDDDLVLGIYASPAKAAEVVERVQEVVGAKEVVLSTAPADHFEELAEQYRIEHGG